MCGINLLLGPEGPWAERAVAVMNRAISHRGKPGRSRVNQVQMKPTGQNRFTLGHVRLPIQGLGEEFDQPFDDGGRYVFAFVGEIFNFKEEDPTLKSDLQYLVQTFRQNGWAAFAEYDGFWSVVIVDRLLCKAYVVMDYLAQKPMYYRLDDDGSIVAVSSEIKALTLLGPNSLDPMYMARVQKWGYDQTERTPFRNICRFLPGTMTSIDLDGSMEVFRPDSLALRDLPPDGHLASVVERSVRRRMVSDVPVAMLLSGGLDSSIIYQTLRYRIGLPSGFTVYHVDNGEDQYLDMLDLSGVEVVKLKVDGSLGFKGQALYYNEGPVDLGSVLPQFTLGVNVRWHSPDVHVILSGDGADELFGGYKRSMEYDSQPSDVWEELVCYHLPRLDKLMMAHTIELRCPFLGREVVRYALSLPYDERRGKTALKQAFADLVPAGIIGRPKEPLKYQDVRMDPTWWRREMVKKFVQFVVPRLEYERQVFQARMEE